jgi:toxin YoeB
MKYKVEFTKQAVKDMLALRENEPGAFKKLTILIEELKEHPTTGKGKPEPLKGNRIGQWSREITHKHRIIYAIQGEVLIVYVLSAKGHYDDK